MSELEKLEEKLNSFDDTLRRRMLYELAERYGHILPQEESNVNMHFHNFFSYNSKWCMETRNGTFKPSISVFSQGQLLLDSSKRVIIVSCIILRRT
jgi:hypothetical protein